MCVIGLQPPGKQISGNKFRNCWRRNRDGGGMAWVQDGEVMVSKGFFDMKKMLDAYRNVAETHPDSPVLVHFRIGTQGLTNAANTHPFKVRDDMVMAHNGHLAGWHHEKKSDTLLFAMNLLSQLPDRWEDNPAMQELVDSYLVSDKMALLRADKEWFIFNEQSGSWNEGVWYSNASYLKLKKISTTTKWNGHGTTYQYDSRTESWNENSRQHYTEVWGEREAEASCIDGMIENGYYQGLNCSLCAVVLDMYDDTLCNELGAITPLCLECVQDQEQQMLLDGLIQRNLSYAVVKTEAAFENKYPNKTTLQLVDEQGKLAEEVDLEN